MEAGLSVTISKLFSILPASVRLLFKDQAFSQPCELTHVLVTTKNWIKKVVYGIYGGHKKLQASGMTSVLETPILSSLHSGCSFFPTFACCWNRNDWEVHKTEQCGFKYHFAGFLKVLSPTVTLTLELWPIYRSVTITDDGRPALVLTLPPLHQAWAVSVY